MKRVNLIRNKRNISVLMAVLMLSTSLIGCGEVEEETEVIAVNEEQSELNYEMINVVKTDVVSTERLSCTFTQTTQQDAAFSVGGRTIDKLYVQRGDKVKAGDLLIELEIGTLEDDIASLEYQTEVLRKRKSFLDKQEEYDLEAAYNGFAYSSAKDEDALKDLEKRNESIKENYTYQREDLSDDIEFNEMEIADMKRELSNSRIYASMDGMVSYVANNLERSVCKKDETVITVIDGKEGIWAIDNGAQYAQYFHEGDMIDLNVSAGSAKGDYVVTPYQMGSWGDTLKFDTVEGPENDGVDVGTIAYMVMVIEKVEDVTAVPTDALYQAESGYYVYVLDEEGMKSINWVEIGLIGDDYTEIKSGLSVGEQIVRR